MGVDEKLDLIINKLNQHDQKFESIDQKLDEHTQILNALIHGQTDLKANLDGFKLETCKHFEDVKAKQGDFIEMQNKFDAKLDLLEKRTWNNESDVYRLKKIVGIE